MENNTLTIDPETGRYAYPERPAELPEEDEYPREYSLKNFTQKEISDFRYNQSIKGFSINRMIKGEVNILSKDGNLETKPGWIPSESGLIFRSLAIGLVKLTEWIVVERNTGISLMPEIMVEDKEPKDLQLSFDFISKPENTAKDKWFHSDRKATGSTREKAVELAEAHVKNLTKEEWIEIDRKLDYNPAGLEYDLIRTPEQEQIESEWADACGVVNEANDLKMKTDNFYAIYKNIRIHKNSEERPKMTRKKSGTRIAEKLNTRKKAKFFFNQEEYGNAVEIEGVILPIDVDGLPEMRELIIVKGTQFKDTPPEKSHTGNKYYPYEPYMGLGMGFCGSTIKETKENVLDFLTTRPTEKTIKNLNERLKKHKEKITAAQSDQDITPFLQLKYEREPEPEIEAEQKAA